MKIAILGCVSVGKSTLLNALIGQYYSEMKLKRTTMVPQIYKILDNPSEISGIFQVNKEVNSKMPEKVEEVIHFIEKIDDLPGVEIHDIPGLNDIKLSAEYYKYLRESFHQYDVIMIVIDVYSAFNTQDELKLTETVRDLIKTQTSLGKTLIPIIIASKCEDLRDNEEVQEQFKSLQKVAQEIFGEVKVFPLSNKLAFYYSTLKNSGTLTTTQFNELATHEYGKNWKKIIKDLSESEVSKLIHHSYKKNIEESGFQDILNKLNYLHDKYRLQFLLNPFYTHNQFSENLSNFWKNFRISWRNSGNMWDLWIIFVRNWGFHWNLKSTHNLLTFPNILNPGYHR